MANRSDGLTQSVLSQIENWPYPLDFHEFMEFIHQYWAWADFGWFDRIGNTYYLSTGGWSDNESIITAMQNHPIFWALYWDSARRGGHYVFCPMGEEPDER